MRFALSPAFYLAILALFSSTLSLAGDSGGTGKAAYTSSKSLPSNAVGEIVNMLTSLSGTLVYRNGNMQMAPIQLSNLLYPLSPAASVTVTSGGTSGTVTVTDSRFPRMVTSVSGGGMFTTTTFTISNVDTGGCGNWRVPVYASGSGCSGTPGVTASATQSGSNCIATLLGNFTGSQAYANDSFHTGLPATACTTI